MTTSSVLQPPATGESSGISPDEEKQPVGANLSADRPDRTICSDWTPVSTKKRRPAGIRRGPKTDIAYFPVDPLWCPAISSGSLRSLSPISRSTSLV